MTKECPSCGNMVEDDQVFCPMCGTRIALKTTTETKENKFLKDEIAKAEAYATTVLYAKSKIVFNEVNAAELNFLSIIDKFPSEPKAYIAYVNFATKYCERVLNSNEGDEVIYFKDLQGFIDKCKLFLSKAIIYADKELDGAMLQEISELQSKLETFKLDKTIEAQNQHNIKKSKSAKIFGIIFFIGMLLYFIYALSQCS